MTPTEQIKARLHAAYAARNHEEFDKVAAWILVRGYKPILGPRGGLSFEWVGVACQKDWEETRTVFAGIDWKESKGKP